MAVQNLIEQSVIFFSRLNENFNFNDIMVNPLMISLAQNCIGGALLTNYSTAVFQFGGGAIGQGQQAYEFRCLILPAFQITIQNNLAALQAAFPNLTVVTYGKQVVYGA